jgi:protoporphyrinogen/coproporphyrinogen III oxidase
VSISDSTVCVIGGGISGLTTAYTLCRQEPRVRVVLCEASARLGGVIRTDEIDGIRVEAGPDSWLARDPAVVDLCTALGLGDELVSPAVFGGVVWSSGRVVALPRDFVFGMPASPGAAFGARVLSPAGRVRAALEPFIPGTPLDADVAVGELVQRRFGSEVLDRVVDPLLAGTRAGRADEMSLQAALPSVWAAVHGKRSVTRALSAVAEGGGPPPFKTVSGGLSRLVDGLRDASPTVEFRTDARVASIASDDWGFQVTTPEGLVDSTAVVVALPAVEAGRLLAGARPEAARLMESIEHASVATVVLVYPRGAGSPPAGSSGLLVPSSEKKTLSACTWYSEKWPHARPTDGGLVLRCFVGRAGANPAIELDDDELVARVSTEVREALALTAEPRIARVTRLRRSLPQYAVGHAARVDEIESLLKRTPGIWVTGASYRGSGLTDVVGHAQRTAARVLEWLRAVG